MQVVSAAVPSLAFAVGDPLGAGVKVVVGVGVADLVALGATFFGSIITSTIYLIGSGAAVICLDIFL